MLKVKSMLKTSLILIVLSLSIIASAQVSEKNPWFKSKDLLIGNQTCFELFGGAVYPNMTYSTKAFNSVERNQVFLYEVGFSFRFQRGKWFSVSPRLSYFGQGVSMKDENNYSFRMDNLSFALPVEMQFALGKNERKGITKFFVFAGPYIAYPVSGNISAGDFSYDLKAGDITTINWGGEGGLGIRISTFSLESRSNINLRLSYLQGFYDTYSAFEKNRQDQSTTQKLYLDGGKRLNNVIKLTIGIEIPFKNRKLVSFTAGGDGKKTYKKVVVVDEK